MSTIKFLNNFFEKNNYNLEDVSNLLLAMDGMIPIYAFNNKIFIYSFIVSKDKIQGDYVKDLLKWNTSAPDRRHDIDGTGTSILEGAMPTFFLRFFDGNNPSKILEINQDISHSLEIFWSDERKSLCKIDKIGDYEDIVNMNLDNNKVICTLRKKELDHYLNLSDSVLVRLFEFDLTSCDKKESIYKNNLEEIFAEIRKLPISDSYSIRGFQIARPYKENSENRKFASFIIQDFKHGDVYEWTCNPEKLGNYHIESDLPFNTSPAFFRQEVLEKYKSDISKYVIECGTIDCRRQWLLHYDINEEGQVFAYMKDLSYLPYSEQLYWKSFNEEPKAGISKRSMKQDFEGKWDLDPLSSDGFLNDRTHDVLKFEQKYKRLGKDHNHLKNWISNFTSDNEKDIAFRLLNMIEFYSQDKIRSKLKNLHGKLKAYGININSTIFLGLGRGGKSGQHVLYFYRTREPNAEEIITKDGSDIFNEDLLELSRKSIVFVDDFIGVNGKQAINYIKQFFDMPSNLEKKGIINSERKKDLDDILLKIPKFYLAIVGFETGINKLKKELNINVLVEDTLTDENKAFSPKRNIFGNKTEIVRDIIKKIGEKIYPEGPLGWEDNEALIVFNYNTPTNTLPIFWSEGVSNYKWYPLFERYDVKKKKDDFDK